MSKVLSRFKLIPLLFTISALLVLIGLGTWQVKRLFWKENRIAKITMRVAEPVSYLPDDGFDINELEYKKVAVTGRYLNDKEIHLFVGAREFKGESGYDIVTPFETDDGRIIIVNRGWVNSIKVKQEDRPESIIDGETSFVAMIHRGESPAYFTPENDLEKNVWFWIDLDAIYENLSLPKKDYFLRVVDDGSNLSAIPTPGKSIIKHRNDHLQYAITWYSLAIILLVIYFIFHIKQVDGQNGKL